jgi:virginiamycin B lyase
LITPAGVIRELTLPLDPPPRGSQPCEITAGPDGNLWFTDAVNNLIGRITPFGSITEFSVPTPNAGVYDIASGPDGNLWFTESVANKVARITPSGVVTEFPIPTSSSRPTEITAGADGNLWFAETNGNKIARLTPGGVMTEFTVPTPSSRPYKITLGPDGNLWFTEAYASKVGRITPNGVVTEFVAPTPSYLFGLTAGPGGTLWYTTYYTNTLVEPSTAGVVIAQIPLATPGADPSAIVTGPDGSLWFTEQGVGAIGRLFIVFQGQGVGEIALAAPGVSTRSSVVASTSPTPYGPMIVNLIAPSSSAGVDLSVNLVARGRTSPDAPNGELGANSTVLTSGPVDLAPIGWAAIQDLAIDDLFRGVPRGRPSAFRRLR